MEFVHGLYLNSLFFEIITGSHLLESNKITSKLEDIFVPRRPQRKIFDLVFFGLQKK